MFPGTINLVDLPVLSTTISIGTIYHRNIPRRPFEVIFSTFRHKDLGPWRCLDDPKSSRLTDWYAVGHCLGLLTVRVFQHSSLSVSSFKPYPGIIQTCRCHLKSLSIGPGGLVDWCNITSDRESGMDTGVLLKVCWLTFSLFFRTRTKYLPNRYIQTPSIFNWRQGQVWTSPTEICWH